MLIGGIEAGGTKFVCAVGDEAGHIHDKVSFPTRDPEETLDDAKRFFDQYDIKALGIGTFGPVDLDRTSDTYGHILNTPKQLWKNYDLLGRLKQDYSLPVQLDTDVNVACLGEYLYGAGKDTGSCLYITVGTGVGAGLVVDGQTYQGKNHSEMGHILLSQHAEDSFKGSCPYHGNCLEGLASGPAIEGRYGKKGHLLSENEAVWELEAFYLAQAIMSFTAVLHPEKIILGGGVMKQNKLYPLVREKFMALMNGYLDMGDPEKFIVCPELDDEQGVKGAIALTLK